MFDVCNFDSFNSVLTLDGSVARQQLEWGVPIQDSETSHTIQVGEMLVHKATGLCAPTLPRYEGDLLQEVILPNISWIVEHGSHKDLKLYLKALMDGGTELEQAAATAVACDMQDWLVETRGSVKHERDLEKEEPDLLKRQVIVQRALNSKSKKLGIQVKSVKSALAREIWQHDVFRRKGWKHHPKKASRLNIPPHRWEEEEWNDYDPQADVRKPTEWKEYRKRYLKKEEDDEGNEYFVV